MVGRGSLHPPLRYALKQSVRVDAVLGIVVAIAAQSRSSVLAQVDHEIDRDTFDSISG